MQRKIILPLFILLLLFSSFATAFAEGFDINRTGSVTVTLLDSHKDPIVGAAFDVCYVATVGMNTDKNLNYIYTDAFENCSIPLVDPQLAAKLSAYIDDNQIVVEKITTDFNGKAGLDNLPLGMYLIKQVGTVEGFSQCTPFLVTVPIQNGSDFVYDIDAAPKTDIVRLVTVNVKKVWNTSQKTSIPTSITVELLRGDEVMETAVLSKNNNWQIAYSQLPESDSYTVREINVPKGYTPTYSKNGYDFTVTNTPALAQTGQLIWPIPILAVFGLLFMTIGFVILRKTGGADA